MLAVTGLPEGSGRGVAAVIGDGPSARLLGGCQGRFSFPHRCSLAAGFEALNVSRS